MNQLKLVASVSEKTALRYTPAGIPIVSGTLRHISKQKQAAVEREVDLEIFALAAGDISQQFQDLPLGSVTVFSGFLARKTRNSKSLVFHIIEIETNLLD